MEKKNYLGTGRVIKGYDDCGIILTTIKGNCYENCFTTFDGEEELVMNADVVKKTKYVITYSNGTEFYIGSLD